MSRAQAKCGTPSGYARHLRLGEETCADCRRAQSERSRQTYATNPTTRAKYKARASAQMRAYSRLAHMYPAVYAALYAEEKEATS